MLFDDDKIEFIGHNGLHYKLIENKFHVIEHKVLAKDYEIEMTKLSKLLRNYNYPYSYEYPKVIKPIKIDIIEDEFYYNKSRYFYNICGWDVLCLKKNKNN